MVRGSDASDVAMITSLGRHSLSLFRVWAEQIADGLSDNQFLDMLETRPDAAALVYSSSARAA